MGNLPGFNRSLRDMTGRIREMHDKVAREVERDPLFGGGTSFSLRDKLDGSRFIFGGFQNLVASIGGGSVVGANLSDYTNKLSQTGQAAQRPADVAIAAIGDIARGLAYPVGAPMAAPAAPASAAPAGTSGSITIGDEEDSAEEIAAKKDKIKPGDLARMKRDIRLKGYKGAEVDKIMEAIQKRAGGSKTEANALIASLPKRKGVDDDTWRVEFAKWYAGDIGDMNESEVNAFIDENISDGGGQLKLARDSSAGGKNHRGARVLEDCDALSLKSGDKVAFDKTTGKLHRLDASGKKLDAEVPGGITMPSGFDTAADDTEVTIDHDKGTKPKTAVADKKDAVSMIQYMASNGIEPVPLKAEEPETSEDEGDPDTAATTGAETTAPAAATLSPEDTEKIEDVVSGINRLADSGLTARASGKDIEIAVAADKKDAIRDRLEPPDGMAVAESVKRRLDVLPAGSAIVYNGKRITQDMDEAAILRAMRQSFIETAAAAPAEPVAPAEEPVAPAEEPVAPAEEPVAPAEEPVAPAEEPVAPAGEAEDPPAGPPIAGGAGTLRRP